MHVVGSEVIAVNMLLSVCQVRINFAETEEDLLAKIYVGKRYSLDLQYK